MNTTQNTDTRPAQRSRSQFECNHGSHIEATTIAPTPVNGTLSDAGWRFVTRDADGIELFERNADDARRSILRSFGHR